MRCSAATPPVTSTEWMFASTHIAGFVEWCPVVESVSVTRSSGRPSWDVPYCSTDARPGWAATMESIHDDISSWRRNRSNSYATGGMDAG